MEWHMATCKSHINKMRTVQMHTLRWMWKKTIMEQLHRFFISEQLEVVLIEYKISEHRLYDEIIIWILARFQPGWNQFWMYYQYSVKFSQNLAIFQTGVIGCEVPQWVNFPSPQFTKNLKLLASPFSLPIAKTIKLA